MSSDKDKAPLSTPDASPAAKAPEAAAPAAPARPAPALPSHSLFRAGREDGHDDHHDDPHEDQHGDQHHDHPSGPGRAWHDEADHSMADFDLGREIDARFDRDAWAASGASSPAGAKSSASLINASTEHDDDYFPEDERSSMDWESDHSMTDFDLREELFNRLGEAPPEEAPSAPPSGEGAGDAATDHAGAPAHAAGAPADADDEPHDGYYPEDERSSLDWEDDHSMTSFDLEREVAGQAQKAANNGPAAGANGLPVAVGAANAGGFPAAAGVCGVSIAAGTGRADALDPDYFPEDERSSMDWESDHSTAEFDLNAEIDSRLGKGRSAPESGAGQPGTPAAPQAGTGPESAPAASAQHAAADEGYMHPGLAAALSASLAYAQQGLQDASSGNTGKDAGKDAAKSAAKSASGGPCPASAAAADGTAPAAALAGSGKDAAARGSASSTSGKNSDSPSSGGENAGPEQEKRRPFDDAEDDGEAALSSSSGNNGDDEEKERAETPPAPAGGIDPGGGGVPPANPPADDEEDDEEEDDEDKEDEEEDDGEDDGDEEEDDGGLGRPMTLRDHLTELRKRITRAFLWMLVGFIACYPVAEELFALLFKPLTRVLPDGGRLIYTSPPEAFFTYMKVAFVAGIFLASPMIFYQIWAFVAPGLYKEEKAHVVPVAVFSALFFICGGAFCYFVAFPFAFEFFMSYSTGVIVAMPALNETLSFVLQLLLAFGLIFELPLFVFFLARLGIVTADMMRKFRRYSILANVIIAAILTPPDVMSQMLMAGPLILLYELSILIAAAFGKKKPEPAKEDDEDDDDDDDEEDEEDDDLEDDSGDDDEDEGEEKAPAPAKP